MQPAVEINHFRRQKRQTIRAHRGNYWLPSLPTQPEDDVGVPKSNSDHYLSCALCAANNKIGHCWLFDLSRLPYYSDPLTDRSFACSWFIQAVLQPSLYEKDQERKTAVVWCNLQFLRIYSEAISFYRAAIAFQFHYSFHWFSWSTIVVSQTSATQNGVVVCVSAPVNFSSEWTLPTLTVALQTDWLASIATFLANEKKAHSSFSYYYYLHWIVS